MAYDPNGRFIPEAQAQKLTLYLLLAGMALYLVYDVFAYQNGGYSTISSVSLSELYLHPAYTMMLGALMGHLTWPSVAARAAGKSLVYVIPTMVALGLWDHYFPVQHPVWPIWPFVAGIPIGHFMFPQDVAIEEIMRK